MTRTLAAFLLLVLLLLAIVPRPAAAQAPPPGPLPAPTRRPIPPGALPAGQAALSAPAAAPAIRLQSGTFVPGPGQPGTVSAGANGRSATLRNIYIVQFRGPIRPAWTAALAALGGDFLGYLPDFAYKMRLSGAQAGQAAALDQVIWVGLFLPQYKHTPDLPVPGTAVYRLAAEDGADAARLRAAVSTTGAALLSHSAGALLVAADPAQFAALRALRDVAWLEPYLPPETHNESGGGLILRAAAANLTGFDGSTQTIAVADTGLGDGTAAGAHPGLPAARITAIFNRPGVAGGCFASILDDGAKDVDLGHGTHVAASALGGGDQNGVGRGVAPAARLVFQSVESWGVPTTLCQQLYGYRPGYYLLGLPGDLMDLYQQAYDAGARIHSNSWGSSTNGAYTTDSANTDGFIWNHPDMTITFSAGNAARDANRDGLIDPDSIGSPSTAKNVITVGASENARADNFPCDRGQSYLSGDAYQSGQNCAGMNGRNILGTAGQRWGFTAEPLNSDPTAGNAQQMASFSSRGPADDGRIKPDVVAPGAWLLSAYSSQFRQGYGGAPNPQNDAYQFDGYGLPYSGDYKYFGGTSMSNPLVAGAAAVVRDFYQKTYDLDAHAALVKATLVNSAVDLLDENNDGRNDNDFPIPNIHEGWGLVDLRAATDGSHLFLDSAAHGGLTTGFYDSYPITSVAGTAPLKVTLAWSDYPGATAAAGALVNTLYLRLRGPGGADYWGNDFSGGWSRQGGAADGANNVQNVFVQNPAAGTWTIEVYGANIPQGPQSYALVAADTSRAAAPAALALDLPAGWNLISAPLLPADPALDAIFSALGGKLLLVKNGAGQVYWPELGINTIGAWDVRDGYQVYLRQPGVLALSGTPIQPAQLPLPLGQGWNMVAYTPTTPLPPAAALASIQAHILLVKNGAGQVYWPELGINTIGQMRPGQGYQIYLTAPATLTYPN